MTCSNIMCSGRRTWGNIRKRAKLDFSAFKCIVQNKCIFSGLTYTKYGVLFETTTNWVRNWFMSLYFSKTGKYMILYNLFNGRVMKQKSCKIYITEQFLHILFVIVLTFQKHLLSFVIYNNFVSDKKIKSCFYVSVKTAGK